MMKVLVTGSDGFIGKNLVLRLRTLSFVQALCFTRMDDISTLSSLIEDSDFIVHLAGANRPKHSQGFVSDNVDLTERIVNLLKTRKAKTGTIPPIFFASSLLWRVSSV